MESTGPESGPAEERQGVKRLDELCAQVREQLQEGGPPVNEPDLCSYSAGVLPSADAAEVQSNILTWKDWFEAYRKISADAALYNLLAQLDERAEPD